MELTVSTLSHFVVREMPWYKGKEKEVEEILLKHIEYNTLDFISDYRGIIYVIRYNISQSGRICEVLDLCVRRDKRNKGIIKFIIARNWMRWPQLRYFRFYRNGKYPGREGKIYKIMNIFKKDLVK